MTRVQDWGLLAFITSFSTGLYGCVGDPTQDSLSESTESSSETSSSTTDTSGTDSAEETETGETETETGETETGETETGETETGETETGGEDECESLDETMCEDGMLVSCVEEDEFLVWGDPVACDTGFICKQSACEELSAAQLSQISLLGIYADHLRDHTGYAEVLDFEGLVAAAAHDISLGEGDDYTFAKAIYSIYRAVPFGHSAIGLGPLDWSQCYDPNGFAPLRGNSWYGVCARSAGDASIVTFADEINPMGLTPGDRVVAIIRGDEIWEGPDMLERISYEPLCDGGIPSESGRADYNALHVFAVIKPGDAIEVLHPDQSLEVIDVPERGDQISCFDPFRREERGELFASHQREDGVVVIILPTLGSHADHPFPQPLSFQGYRDWNAEAIELLNEDLAQYNDIAGIVWDIRGNRGGSAEYGMGIFGSLGDVAGGLGECHARIIASSPPEFSDAVEYPFPYQIFVDDPLPTLNFDGEQVIVADGMSVSAADWLLYRAAELEIPIYGHGGTGAYGYQTGPSYVTQSWAPVEGEHTGIDSYVSGARCLDSEGESLEGYAPVTVELDYDPQDLADGIDTLIEAAVADILEP
ncbi:hypothetical protein [Enhygromyxa salina]|uniref:Tail specific protease domain-containing protein n=1 Tax=Enhygromyxa salina TaxID=215803 RepID=A0A2S9YUJ9_9BACT|nr:hypothetical protein [Enhygromyxa salina]PRQ08768.1 hypothetical protein ENSA7_14000 [Enhygromyxa salina]